MRTLRIPLLPELAVDKIWQEAIQQPLFLNYMPTEWRTHPKKRERPFFYGVLTTLAEPYESSSCWM